MLSAQTAPLHAPKPAQDAAPSPSSQVSHSHCTMLQAGFFQQSSINGRETHSFAALRDAQISCICCSLVLKCTREAPQAAFGAEGTPGR